MIKLTIIAVAFVPMLAACNSVYTDPGEHHVDAPPHAPPDAPADAAPITTTVPKQVFVTSKPYQAGLLGGFSGADGICNTLAQAANRTGTFKAWLSDPTTAARDRMVHSSGGYHLVDGTAVASSWDQLVSGTLDHAIDLDETGALYSAKSECGAEIPVFTGTTYQGVWATDNTQACGGWTQLYADPDGGIGNVMIGDASATTSYWTALLCEPTCLFSAAFYCVEQ